MCSLTSTARMNWKWCRMNSLLSVVLILLPVLVMLLLLQADKHYRHMHTKGRQDAILHLDRSDKLTGLNQWSYKRGQEHQKNLMSEGLTD